MAPGRDRHSDCGKSWWLWRAVDSEGEVLDMLVQPKRDKAAALKLMRKLLKKQRFAPGVLVTDTLRSYACAKRELGLSARHEQGWSVLLRDGAGQVAGALMNRAQHLADLMKVAPNFRHKVQQSLQLNPAATGSRPLMARAEPRAAPRP